MVDGALGMGFGPTSSSILLGTGLSPAAVATTVNLAKVATGLSAGVAHWRFRNIDRRLVLRLAIPGSLGALFGVTVLAAVDGATLRPFPAALLLVGMLVRFSRLLPAQPAETKGELRPPGLRRTGCLRRCRSRRGDQWAGWRVGPGRHALSAASRPRAPLRNRIGQHC